MKKNPLFEKCLSNVTPEVRDEVRINMDKELLQDKINRAIRLITTAVGDGEVEICYSGGKDSDVILELAKMSGVKYRAIYKNTTIDPPGTIAHCKRNGVEVMSPTIRFFDLVAKKGFPTRRARFCCEKLKEYKVMDTAIQGIRRCESTARAKRYSSSDPIICRMYGSKKNHVNVILPILDWTDEDVAEFINERGIKCHKLYYDDKGNFHPERRLGCIGCPMSQRGQLDDFMKYPKMVQLWIKAAQKWWDAHPDTGCRKKFNNIYELFVHNVFFRTYEDFRLAVDDELFEGDAVDCKKFIEKKFNIKL